MKHQKEYDKTLTQEQLDAPYYVDWDNETLGGLVRAIIADLSEVEVGEYDKLINGTGVTLLIYFVEKVNGGKMIQTVTRKNGEVWRITTEKISEAEQ